MKKVLSTLFAGVLTLGVCFLGGCSLFSPKSEGTTPEEYFKVGSAEFVLNEDNGKFYPTLTGYFESNFIPDKVTLDCNNLESDVLYTVQQVEKGYRLDFKQVILYQALGQYEYPATFTVHRAGWELEVEQPLTLSSKSGYTLNEECTALEYKDVWKTSMYTGITVESQANKITVNGFKKGAAIRPFAVRPFVLEPGTYEFTFTMVDGTIDTVNGDIWVAFGIKLPGYSDTVTCLPYLKKVGNSATVTYIVTETITVKTFNIWANPDNLTFTDATFEWSFVKGE